MSLEVAERWERVKRLFTAALEQTPSTRNAFLAGACGDSSVRDEVEALLAAHENAGTFLKSATLPEEKRRAGKQFFAGTRIGPYEIVGFLGAGGMGQVYRARDARLGREVAIKVLPAAVLDDSAMRRFEVEARAAGSLNHPNILAVYDVGTHESGPYLVSELLEGKTLREQLARKPLAVYKIIDLAIQLAQGLSAAHDHGVVHRDLKPENLFITNQGRLKILDFGLARLAREETAGKPVTQAGMVMGTVGYMSPEQVRGLPVDQRSDLFSCGLILHEMLTGKAAFERPSAAEIGAAIVNEDPPALPATTPPALAKVVARCLEKDARQRFQTAHDLAFELARIDSKVEPVSLISELKRRRVFRALIGYGIVAFAVLQIIEPIMHGMHWPDAVLSYVVVALAIGFPIVVGLAWIFDVNEGRIERPPSAASLRGARLALVLVSIGVLAAAPGTFWYFYVRGIQKPARVTAAASIAVLPFVNLSSDKEQEYFSDGIAEDILNALAQVDGLRVIGRTSSFSMKGKNEDLRSIGQKLDAANLLEGSVRKSGTHVRITAQLVEVAGGSHLWSQQFDRELTDVFAVQDEIAKAVVAALKLKLLPARTAAIDEQRTTNPEAHDQYMLGRHFYELGSGDGYGRALQALKRAVALDPGYAPAWAALSQAAFWARDQDAGRYDAAQAFLTSRAAAEKAIELAPDFAGGYSARAGLRIRLERDWSGGRADLERALLLNPRDAEALVLYAWLLATTGKLPEAIAAGRKAVALDPLSTENWIQLSAFHMGTGELDLAEVAVRRALDVSPDHSRAARNLGFIYLLRGQLREARAAFQQSRTPFFQLMGEALVEYQLGHAAEAQRAFAEILASPLAIPGGYQIVQVSAWRGEADRAFEWLETCYRHRDGGLGYLKYDPLLRKIRGDPRYAALLKKMNLPID